MGLHYVNTKPWGNTLCSLSWLAAMGDQNFKFIFDSIFFKFSVTSNFQVPSGESFELHALLKTSILQTIDAESS